MYMYYVTSQFKYVMIDISNESICSGCFGDPLLSADGGVARVTEKGGNVSGRSKRKIDGHVNGARRRKVAQDAGGHRGLLPARCSLKLPLHPYERRGLQPARLHV